MNYLKFIKTGAAAFQSPSIMARPRFATEDIENSGQQIKKEDGDSCNEFTNRDELQFSYPEELDLTCSNKLHMAFGQGTHMCLGAPVARVEEGVALPTLRRIPNLQFSIPREDVNWQLMLSSQGLKSLSVAF